MMMKIVSGLILVVFLSAAGAARKPQNRPDAKMKLTSPNAVVNTAGRIVSGTMVDTGQPINGVRFSQSSSAAANGSTALSTTNQKQRLEKDATFLLRLRELVGN